ncbi:PQQ-like beta-propeller repeat protein [Streptomyces sp. NBC_00237]|uniref:outer membrane protein assembly factor BamB family protein n=1 Tax=Streptomyces sp. NBC_00237 TaxID=2975687 RepID=UPI002257A1FC|nr:PQQ-binding-like beta-propeller repeat protein [Streptomyces sp. NBC_00237]MCX5206238.1 PQQ-like beta-propeller repeat protein [Streptomyces sp. NBC_00237]
MTQPPPYPNPSPHQPPEGFGPPRQAPPGAFGPPRQAPPGAFGPPPPGPGGGRKLTTRMRVVIAAAVAAVLIIGGGIWYANSGQGGQRNAADGASGPPGNGGGGKAAVDGPGKEKAPPSTRSRVAFQLPEPVVTDDTKVTGSWLTDTVYVKTGVTSISGYDITNGTPLWTIPLPGQLCAASRHTSKDNRTAIAFEAGKPGTTKDIVPCTEVGAIDLTTGRLLWSTSVTGDTTGNEKVRFDEVTLSGNTVAASGEKGGAAWDLTDGRQLWKPRSNTEKCADEGYGGGEALVAVRRCGPYENRYVEIQNVNTATGTPISTFRMPRGFDYPSIVSTRPLVVAAKLSSASGGGSGISDFFSIDEKTGKLRTIIPAPADRYAADCPFDEVDGCHGAVVGNGRIYLPTKEHQVGTAQFPRTNEIVSLDLTTGKPTSDKADAGERHEMYPLRMDGGNVIAYRAPLAGEGSRQIVSIDGAVFQPVPLLESRVWGSAHGKECAFSSGAEILYAHGRLFMSGRMIGKPRKSSTDEKKCLAMAYTTG